MIRELIEKRARLAQEATDILNRAKDGVLNAEEEAKFNALHAEVEALSRSIEMREKQDQLAKYLEQPQERRVQPVTATVVTPMERAARDRDLALRGWFLFGSEHFTAAHEEAAQRLGLNLHSRSIRFNLANRPPRTVQEALELRGQTVGTPAAGGYTVPDEAMRAVEVALLEFGGMRQRATVIRTASGAPLPIPTANDATTEGEIIAEEGSVGNHAGITFGQVVLRAYKYSSKPVLVSLELLQDSSVDIASFIGERLGERIARVQNKHFTVGAGTTEPWGIVTRATEGLAPAGSVAGGITYDHLVDMEHSVDVAYRQGAAWMFHDLTLAKLKKIKDGDGRPIWQPGLAAGAPNTILGYPYQVNNHMASAQTNGTRVMVFGDLRKYLIRDVMTVELFRLSEKYIENGQVAFLAFARSDGDLLDAGTNPVKYFAYAT